MLNINKEKEDIVRKYIIQPQMIKMSEAFYENQLSTIIEENSELPDSVWNEIRLQVNEQEKFLNEFVILYMDYIQAIAA